MNTTQDALVHELTLQWVNYLNNMIMSPVRDVYLIPYLYK